LGKRRAYLCPTIYKRKGGEKDMPWETKKKTKPSERKKKRGGRIGVDGKIDPSPSYGREEGELRARKKTTKNKGSRDAEKPGKKPPKSLKSRGGGYIR